MFFCQWYCNFLVDTPEVLSENDRNRLVSWNFPETDKAFSGSFRSNPCCFRSCTAEESDCRRGSGRQGTMPSSAANTPLWKSSFANWPACACRSPARHWRVLDLEVLESHLEGLADWEAEKERLETELAREIPEMNLDQKLRAADRGTVALNLPEGVALVEFVRFSVFDFHAVPARVEPGMEACALRGVRPA